MQYVNADASYNRSEIMKRAHEMKKDMLDFKQPATLGFCMRKVWKRAREERTAHLAMLDFRRVRREAEARVAADPAIAEGKRLFTMRVNQMIDDAKYIEDPFAYQAEMNRINRLRFEPITNVIGVNANAGA